MSTGDPRIVGAVGQPAPSLVQVTTLPHNGATVTVAFFSDGRAAMWAAASGEWVEMPQSMHPVAALGRVGSTFTGEQTR